MALIKFYKTGEKWVLGNYDGYPAGTCVRYIDPTSGVIYIRPSNAPGNSDKAIEKGLPIQFCNEGGTAYADLAAFKAATDDFFVKAAGITSGVQITNALGYTPAPLDSGSKVPAANLPSTLAVGAIDGSISYATNTAPSSYLHSKTSLPKSDLVYVNRANHGFFVGFVQNGGNVNSDSSWRHTNLLSVEDIVVLNGSLNNNYLGAVYDSNGNYLSYITSKTDVSGGISIALSQIANAAYYSINVPLSAIGSVIILSKADYTLYGSSNARYSKYRLQTQLAEIEKLTLTITNKLSGVTYTDGYYIGNTGSLSSLGSASVTDYIDVNYHDVYFTNDTLPQFSQGGCMYDKNHNLISSFTFIETAGYKSIKCRSAKYIRLNVNNRSSCNPVLLSVYDYKKVGKIGVNNLFYDNAVYPAYECTMRGNNTFIGATNMFIDAILALKPSAKFVLIGHYTKDGITGDGWLEKLIDTQKKLAEYWGVKFIQMHDKFGLVKKGSQQNTLLANISDQIHPASNLSLIANMASVITSEILPLISDWNSKKLLWIGTSIPAGFNKPSDATSLQSQYPLQVAQSLGCTCNNASVSGSVMRTTKSSGSALSTNRYSYLSHLSDYTALIGTQNDPDIWVIDMGYNDFDEDATDFDI